MNDVTRIGGYSGQLNMEQIEKLRALAAARLAGTTLNSAPVPVPPPVVAPVPVEEPIRMPSPEAVRAWRTGANQDIASGVTANPNAAAATAPPMPRTAVARPPAAFPTEGAAPIVATRPAVEQGPAGISLASNPMALGWAGTVGLPGTPEESKAFDKGQKYNELIAGLGEISKGFKPKPAGDTGANTITPMSSQPNAPSQLSAELMNTILQSKKRPRGLTLTG